MMKEIAKLRLATIDSTNNEAKRRIAMKKTEEVLIIAEQQTQGRGRLGRSFDSNNPYGIYMSLVLVPNIDAKRLSCFTLLAALAVTKALEKVCNIEPAIKWPNDILVKNRKVVGILTETVPLVDSSTQRQAVICGIGINVTNPTFPKELRDKAGSLFTTTEKAFNKEAIINAFLEEFYPLYESYLMERDIAFMQGEYNKRLSTRNHDVYLIPQEMTLSYDNPNDIPTEGLPVYRCTGIDAYGQLLCRDAIGEFRKVYTGEIVKKTS